MKKCYAKLLAVLTAVLMTLAGAALAEESGVLRIENGQLQPILKIQFVPVRNTFGAIGAVNSGVLQESAGLGLLAGVRHFGVFIQFEQGFTVRAFNVVVVTWVKWDGNKAPAISKVEPL